MEINALTGVEPIGLLSVPTNRRVNGARHKLNNYSYAVARESFKKILQYNIFGLASVIFKAWKNPSTMTKWKYAWYNLGGNDWQTLFDKANYGKFKKPKLMKLAPKKIKAAYAAAGKKIGCASIAGNGSVPIGMTGAEVAALAAQIGAILTAIGGLFGATIKEGAGAITEEDLNDGSGGGNNGGSGGAGSGISLGNIGIIIPLLLGAGLLMGTKTNKQKK